MKFLNGIIYYLNVDFDRGICKEVSSIEFMGLMLVFGIFLVYGLEKLIV